MSELRAAQMSAHFHRWMMAEQRVPLWLPSRWAEFAPMPVGAVPRIVSDEAHSALRRRAVVGTLGSLASSNAGVKHRMERYLGHHSWPPEAARPKCECCAAYVASKVPGDAEPSARSEWIWPAVHNCTDIKFDYDTRVTKVTETVTFKFAPEQADATSERVASLLRAGSPENWARTSSYLSDERDPFYLESTPGNYVQGSFNELEAEEAKALWKRPEGGQLKEVVNWNWNVGSAATAEIILTISNYSAGILGKPDTGFDSVHGAREDNPFVLRYDFVLFRCQFYTVGAVRYRDILDVDGGSYEATYYGKKGKDGGRGGKGEHLTITASKSLHFPPPAGQSDEIVTVLNLLNPALVSLLMHELVYEGPMALLNATPGELSALQAALGAA
ncbi:MAG: hypothetical protein MJD61_07595 [Proteobacteria bacterium]|nr:hypothetical protein [Pseudomonadota bacterium]